MKLYPAWLKALRPDLSRVSSPDAVNKNNYYIFSGNGFPSLLHKHLNNAVQDVNRIGRFSAFVVILDADDATAHARTEEVLSYYSKNSASLANGLRFIVVVQNKCIETWLLGNKKMFKRNPQSQDYRDCIKYYNVHGNDPELMGAMPPFEFAAQFHEAYLVEMFQERNQRYSKRNPGTAGTKDYLNSLIARSGDGDIKSFKGMLDAVKKL